MGHVNVVKSKHFNRTLIRTLITRNTRVILVSASHRGLRRLSSCISGTDRKSTAGVRTLRRTKVTSYSAIIITVNRGVRNDIVTAIGYGSLNIHAIITGTASRIRKHILQHINTSIIVFPGHSQTRHLTEDLLATDRIRLFRITSKLYTTRISAPSTLTKGSLTRTGMHHRCSIAILTVHHLSSISPTTPERLLVPGTRAIIHTSSHLLIFKASRGVSTFTRSWSSALRRKIRVGRRIVVQQTALRSIRSVRRLVRSCPRRLVLHPVGGVIRGVSHFAMNIIKRRLITYTY